MMAAVPRILEPQCGWNADEVADESTWTELLDDAEQAELDAALRHALAHSDDVLELERDDFPLPTLAARIADIERELIDGRGFVRIRGIDRSRYTQTEMEILYWGIGMHLGRPWPQNKHGHVLGDVTDQGKAADDPTARGNELGGIALPFHCDGTDLVGLLCLVERARRRSVRRRQLGPDPQPARRGAAGPGGGALRALPLRLPGRAGAGGPGLLRAAGVHRVGRPALRALHPAVHPRLAAPPGRAPPERRCRSRRCTASSRWRTTRPHHVRMELLPGDIQFINNYHVLHGRTAYEDDRGAGQVRHLKRLWLETSVLAEPAAALRSQRQLALGRPPLGEPPRVT